MKATSIRLPVEIAVKVEQEHLEQGRSVVEHRPAAEARDAVMTFSRNASAHSVNAVLETAGRA